MAEDSGAFKTNRLIRARFQHFVMIRERRCREASPAGETRFATPPALAPPIFNKRHESVAVFSKHLIRWRRRCPLTSPSRSVLWSPRFRCSRAFARALAKVEFASMLPGLRFLFAATVLTMSILIFGLGAAALLRAAHEEVASTPSRRVMPETIFAAPIEAARPTLALLRVEPLAVEPKPADNVAVAEPAAQPADASMPADRIAALKPEDTASPDAVKPEIPPAQAPTEAEAAPAAADAPAPAGETRMASTEPVAAALKEAASTAPEQASAPASADADMAATKIATLGGPPVAIETLPPAKAAGATADQSAVKKRLQAQRAKERRRIAQRARLARQAQQAADPFSQPTITTRAK
jgi:hypothetical protein